MLQAQFHNQTDANGDIGGEEGGAYTAGLNSAVAFGWSSATAAAELTGRGSGGSSNF